MRAFSFFLPFIIVSSPFLLIKFIYFYLFYIWTTVSPPSSPPMPPHLPSTSHQLLWLLSERGQPLIGVNKAWHTKLRQDQTPLPASRLGEASLHGEFLKKLYAILNEILIMNFLFWIQKQQKSDILKHSLYMCL